jgi:hypothetical protein
MTRHRRSLRLIPGIDTGDVFKHCDVAGAPLVPILDDLIRIDRDSLGVRHAGVSRWFLLLTSAPAPSTARAPSSS